MLGALLVKDYNWYQWSGLTFFLYEYELHLLKGSKPDLGYDAFGKSRLGKTVEHILPQTATSRYWTSRFPKRDRQELLHSLGNLVLTRDNSSYSNKDFPDKRGSAGPGIPAMTCYAQSQLAQEQELAVVDEWTPEEVAARHNRIAAWAMQRWWVDAAEVSEFEDSEWTDPT